MITNRPSAIVYDPEHADTFWEAGIYNGGGVYKTEDNGKTFVQLGKRRPQRRSECRLHGSRT